MENNWEPRVGQKVTLIESAPTSTHFKKGVVYEVAEVFKLPCCGSVMIGCKEFPTKPGATHTYCSECGERTNTTGKLHYYGGPSKYFAPVISYPDQTAEIAQQFIEHPDKADQPIKILETVN